MGDEIAQYNLANCYFYGEGVEQNYKKQYIGMKNPLKKNLMCIKRSRWIYHQGISVPKNYNNAIKYYIQARESSYSQNHLGTLYRLGQGVEADFLKASEYYNNAIRLDKAYNDENGWPYYHLGIMKLDGMGIKKDVLSAIKLLKEASKNVPLAGLKLRNI